jgi:hypothetical protein
MVKVEVPADQPPPPPLTPTDLVATTVDDTGIKLTWNYDEALDLTGFRLERGDEACTEASFVQLALLPKTVREFTDTGLTAETTYCYRLQAYLIGPASANSTYSATVTATTLEDDGNPPVDPNDKDGDGDINILDNCPEVSNSEQENFDQDEQGDVCDSDADNDGVSNDEETAQGTNPLDVDSDDDGPNDANDNCPALANAGQEDGDQDDIGDVCDTEDNSDVDGDGFPNDQDNCPQVPNDQADADQDNVGDACDLAPSTNTPSGGCSLAKTSTEKSSGMFWIWISLGILAAMGKIFPERA